MWEDLELDPENIPALKLGFHIAQIVCGFVLWCLEIAVFRNAEAKIVGKNGWTFAVFFLSIPAWIYLIGTPRFPRTRKFAEPHVMLVVDVVFTVIWLSAFATQAAYNTENLCGTACGASKAIVAFGFFTFLFFGVTTFLSIWTLKYYQWNNRLPGYDRAQLGGGSAQNIDPDKAAFDLAPHDDEAAYAPVSMSDHHDHDHDNDTTYGGGPGAAARSDYSDPYGGSQVGGGGGSIVSGYQDNPFRQHETASPFDNDTEYHHPSGRVSAAGGGRYAAPSAVDGFEEEDHSGPARFPAANYDRIER